MMVVMSGIGSGLRLERPELIGIGFDKGSDDSRHDQDSQGQQGDSHSLHSWPASIHQPMGI